MKKIFKPSPLRAKRKKVEILKSLKRALFTKEYCCEKLGFELVENNWDSI